MASWDWQDRAACRGILDFTDRPMADQVPVCRRCPVRFECLELGIEQASSYPTVAFGGVDGDELVRLRRERPASDKPRRGRWTGRIIKRCEVCHVDFSADSSLALYCSRSCGEQAYKRRRALKLVRS